MAQKHVYQSGRAPRQGNTPQPQPRNNRSAYNQDYQDDYDPYLPPPVKMKKRRRWPKVLLALVLVFGILGTGVFAMFTLLDEYVEPGEFGIHNTGSKYVPKNYGSDLVHILVAGIDNEEGRNYGEGRGLTDMLLYARFDLKTTS